MTTSIAALPAVDIDLSLKGPGLGAGLQHLERLLSSANGRTGHVLLNVTAGNATIPVVLARSDLYVLGFRCGPRWMRFDDAAWSFTEPATALGHDGSYASLGGLTGNLTPGAILGIAKLAAETEQRLWRESLRTLIVVVCESARLVPVNMQILGLLNGVLSSVSLESLARYIQNWDRASKGADMSVEVSPNHRVGFNDPTIIRR